MREQKQVIGFIKSGNRLDKYNGWLAGKIYCLTLTWGDGSQYQRDLERYRGFEGRYKISNLGNVLNVKRYKLRKLQLKKNNYTYVDISKNNKKSWFRVHRLVAQTFIPNPDNLPEINHSWQSWMVNI